MRCCRWAAPRSPPGRAKQPSAAGDTSAAVAAATEKATVVEIPDTPIALAIQQVQQFGVVETIDKASRNAPLEDQKHFAPPAFDKCVRLKLKKLPSEATAVSAWVSNGVPMDSLP